MAIDKNGDGKIAKPELFEILKKLINGWVASIAINSDRSYMFSFYFKLKECYKPKTQVYKVI